MKSGLQLYSVGETMRRDPLSTIATSAKWIIRLLNLPNLLTKRQQPFVR